MKRSVKWIVVGPGLIPRPAHLQFELAWALHSALPESEMRLERPVGTAVGPRMNVDLMVKVSGDWYAFELKYITALLEHEHAGEAFSLKARSVQDQRRYDIFKDISRVEILVGEGTVSAGSSITQTNDASLGMESGRLGSVDADFRAHDGRSVEGSLAWAAGASIGTTRGRESALHFAGEYTLTWRDYSVIDAPQNGEFRALVVEVG